MKGEESLLVKSRDYEISFIKPCTSSRKRLLAEVRLRRGFSPRDLCMILEKARIGGTVKCSEDLGVARIEWKGKTVMVFASGEVSIRRAENKKDAIETANFIKDILLPKS